MKITVTDDGIAMLVYTDRSGEDWHAHLFPTYCLVFRSDLGEADYHEAKGSTVDAALDACGSSGCPDPLADVVVALARFWQNNGGCDA